MNKKQTRRVFMVSGTKFGLACSAIAICPKILQAENFFQDEKPDPKKLNYCGYVCPEDCLMYTATIENSEEKKKEAYKLWKIEERHGIAFDPDQVFCYKCKNSGKPDGIVTGKCTVRYCAMEKEIDCCIECETLETCDKDLWKRFPEFHKGMIKLQKVYQGTA